MTETSTRWYETVALRLVGGLDEVAADGKPEPVPSRFVAGAPRLGQQGAEGSEHHRFELVKVDVLETVGHVDGQQVAFLQQTCRLGNPVHQDLGKKVNMQCNSPLNDLNYLMATIAFVYGGTMRYPLFLKNLLSKKLRSSSWNYVLFFGVFATTSYAICSLNLSQLPL